MVRGDIFNMFRYLSVSLSYLGLELLDTYNGGPFSTQIQVRRFGCPDFLRKTRRGTSLISLFTLAYMLLPSKFLINLQ